MDEYKNIAKELKDEEKRLQEKERVYRILEQYQGEDEVITSEQAKKIVGEDTRPIIETGIPGLDQILKIRPGNVVVVSAPTGSGKTTLCQTMTTNMFKNNHKSLWFSYENDVYEFLEVFGGHDIMPMYYLPKTLRQNEMEWLEERTIEGAVKYGTEIVFIDHLHYLLEFNKMVAANNLSILIGMMMRELVRIARENQVVIFLVSHLKHVSLDGDRMPDLHDLRDSSFVAQEADAVLFIKRKDEILEGNKITYPATLKVAKNRRGGKLGLVPLELINNKFYEYSDNNRALRQDSGQPSQADYIDNEEVSIKGEQGRIPWYIEQDR